MTTEAEPIELWELYKSALDINYLRGTVTVGRKKFTSMEAALAHVQKIKNF